MNDNFFDTLKNRAGRDGFGHERPDEGITNDWITPKWIIDAFDGYAQENLDKPQYFDLDPCSSITQPWICARDAYTVEQDGLRQNWYGTVWCNPPYGSHAEKWVKKLAQHGNGIALIFARIETKLWQDYIFPSASGYLFPRGRFQFAKPDGTTPKSSSGAPSALIAWGGENRDCLIEMVDSGKIPGVFMEMSFYTGSYRSGERENQAAKDKRLSESGKEPAALRFFDGV